MSRANRKSMTQHISVSEYSFTVWCQLLGTFYVQLICRLLWNCHADDGLMGYFCTYRCYWYTSWIIMVDLSIIRILYWWLSCLWKCFLTLVDINGLMHSIYYIAHCLRLSDISQGWFELLGVCRVSISRRVLRLYSVEHLVWVFNFKKNHVLLANRRLKTAVLYCYIFRPDSDPSIDLNNI